ncbi:MAG: hypothetical protein ACE5FB_06200, partial [Candidatus Binatia bacterium]
RSNILALDLLLRDGDATRLPSPALNIGTGRETSVLEIFEEIASILSSSQACHFEPAREGEIRRSALEFGLARKVLSWTPNIKLEEGLRETAAWFSAKNVEVKR